jgi:histidine triad (HIT) family protein
MNDCIFCKIVEGKIKSWKVFENEFVLAFFDVYPASKYHTLVIPKKHYDNIFDISEKELMEIMKAIKTIVNLYKEKLGIENVQILNSSGSEAQQTILHCHFHIIPRKLGDGQDTHLSTHPEWTDEYDQMLSKIKI